MMPAPDAYDALLDEEPEFAFEIAGTDPLDLEAAEEAMLALCCRRAGIEDGHEILDLGVQVAALVHVHHADPEDAVEVGEGVPGAHADSFHEPVCGVQDAVVVGIHCQHEVLDMLEVAEVIPIGVDGIMQLQEQGYSYFSW